MQTVVEADSEKVASLARLQIQSYGNEYPMDTFKNTDGKILVKVLFNEQETKLPIDSEYAPLLRLEAIPKIL